MSIWPGVAKVLDSKLYRDGLQDFLHRLRQPVPPKPSSQDRMPIGYPLPRTGEHGWVDRLPQVADHLLDIDADIAAFEPMKQHSLLQGGGGIDIDDRITGHPVHDTIEHQVDRPEGMMSARSPSSTA